MTAEWPTPEAVTFIDRDALPPNAVVVLEMPRDCTPEMAEELRRQWDAAVGVPCVIMVGGLRVAKVTTELDCGAH